MKLCRLLQRLSPLAGDSNGHIARGLARHRRRCVTCAEAWQSEREIERELARAAARCSVPAPGRLAWRVKAEIAGLSDRADAAPSGTGWRPAAAWALAAIGLIAGAFWWSQTRPLERPAAPGAGWAALEAEANRARSFLTDPAPLGVVADAVAGPLRTELEAMKDDARAVADQLARDLLPSEFLAAGDR